MRSAGCTTRRASGPRARWVSSSKARGAVGWGAGPPADGPLPVPLHPAGAAGRPDPDRRTRSASSCAPRRRRSRTVASGFSTGRSTTLAIVVDGRARRGPLPPQPLPPAPDGQRGLFQLAIAFILPQLLVRLGQPELYPNILWPLDYDLFFPWKVAELRAEGALGLAMLVWGTVALVVATPVLTYRLRQAVVLLVGLRLRRSGGDSRRSVPPTSRRAGRGRGRSERWMVHGRPRADRRRDRVHVARVGHRGWLAGRSVATRSAGSTGSSSARCSRAWPGVGFYPVLGSRIWCRYGVSDGGHPGPPAALLLSLPDHHERRPVHLVRAVLGLL